MTLCTLTYTGCGGVLSVNERHGTDSKLTPDMNIEMDTNVGYATLPEARRGRGSNIADMNIEMNTNIVYGTLPEVRRQRVKLGK